jgi:predicted ATP-grasp superfamily ATP-dependent carboligase
MNRNEKIKILKGLLSGEKTLQSVNRQTVFITHRKAENETGILYDEKMQPITTEQAESSIENARGAFLVWHEVRTYENKSSLLKSY